MCGDRSVRLGPSNPRNTTTAIWIIADLQRAGGDAIKMYSNEASTDVFYNAYRSNDPVIRRVYDLTYNTPRDLVKAATAHYPVRKPADEYDVVSLGKS